jgi:aspartate kinase
VSIQQEVEVFLRDAHDMPIAVVKIGGSILKNARAYRRTATFLRNRLVRTPGERFVAVVSAQNGATDSMERAARRIACPPDTRAVDLLWSTGEIRSVAMLTMHLQALGVAARGLNVQETGLRVVSGEGIPRAVELSAGHIHESLADFSVVVVPGFLATDARGMIRSLGRGGSDLTAVLLAEGLAAARCDLIKDVSGYFSSDPHRDADAQHIPFLTYAQALELAANGCDLVQKEAIEAAAKAELPLVVRSVKDSAAFTVVAAEGEEEEISLAPDANEFAVVER